MKGLWLLFLGAIAVAGYASIASYQFDDPEKEARYKGLIAELRCLVCQNQNLADSNAELARDLRLQTYEMVQRGASNEDVITFMVQRYGDFVLYRPPLKSSTALLWIGPFILLGTGVVLLVIIIRRRARTPAPAMTKAEQAKAEQLLQQIDKE